MRGMELTEPKKRKRGFACMKREAVLRICAMGGKKTAKRHGKAHMARIGRNGRLKRMRMERKAKAEALKVDGADTREHPSRWV